MSETKREIVGFLARWCLLGLAAVMVCATGYLCIRAASHTRLELASRVVLPDFLCQADSAPIPLRCFASPHSPVVRELAWHINAWPMNTAHSHEAYFYLYLNSPLPKGDWPIEAWGDPYSALAFSRQACLVRAIPPTGRLFLIDARTALGAFDLKDGTGLFMALKQMKTLGTVALFYPGLPADMDNARTRLRRHEVAEPVIAGRNPDEPAFMLREAARDLQISRGRITIVTGDTDLATIVQKQGFLVRLISRRQAPPDLATVRSPSFAMYKDILAQEPIEK